MKHVLVCMLLAAACGPVDLGGASTGSGTGGASPAADGGTAPAPAGSLWIVAPADGAKLKLGDDEDEGARARVRVQLDGLRISDSCGADPACGALLLFVDDDRCGNPNARQTGGLEVVADFSRCDHVKGDHRLRVDVWRGSTFVARSGEIHVVVHD